MSASLCYLRLQPVKAFCDGNASAAVVYCKIPDLRYVFARHVVLLWHVFDEY